MATVKDTTCQGGEMERIYKDDGSSTGEQTRDQQKVEHMCPDWLYTVIKQPTKICWSVRYTVLRTRQNGPVHFTQ